MMREYQENFINLYEHLQRPEFKDHKQGKFNYILDILNLHNRNGTCLDLGCSNGIVAKNLTAQFRQIVGSDIDLIALKKAIAEKSNTLDFISGDAMALPFRDQSLDAVVCLQTYEHVPSSEKLFSEIDRVLKNEGIVLFSGPNKTFPIEPHYFLPFLHWLNEKTADAYLKLTRKGDHYYERSRTYWDLKKAFGNYEIIDVVKYVLEYYSQTSPKTITRWANGLASKLPIFFLRLVSPFMVNINWILIKKEKETHDRKKLIFAS
jgi:ubiquinone/menaquinone biosynthesis C-methylase UbiE